MDKIDGKLKTMDYISIEQQIERKIIPRLSVHIQQIQSSTIQVLVSRTVTDRLIYLNRYDVQWLFADRVYIYIYIFVNERTLLQKSLTPMSKHHQHQWRFVLHPLTVKI